MPATLLAQRVCVCVCVCVIAVFLKVQPGKLNYAAHQCRAQQSVNVEEKLYGRRLLSRAFDVAKSK